MTTLIEMWILCGLCNMLQRNHQLFVQVRVVLRLQKIRRDVGGGGHFVCHHGAHFSRPLVKKRVVLLNRNHFCKVRTHFDHDASTRGFVTVELQNSRHPISSHEKQIFFSFHRRDEIITLRLVLKRNEKLLSLQ